MSNLDDQLNVIKTPAWKDWRQQREVIRSHKSKKDRQHNGQEKKDKWTNKDEVTQTPL